MTPLSRRDALKSAGALAVGAAVAGSSTSAQESAVKNARLKQSVCRWCYQRIPLEEFFKGVKAIGLNAVDLLQPNEWDVGGEVRHPDVDRLPGRRRRDHSRCSE